jgi:hypothetical protein
MLKNLHFKFFFLDALDHPVNLDELLENVKFVFLLQNTVLNLATEYKYRDTLALTYVQAGHTAHSQGEKDAPVTNLVKETKQCPMEIKTRHNNLHTAH